MAMSAKKSLGQEGGEKVAVFENQHMSSVYKINKGINKPIEFKGLKAQYIAYLAGGLITLLVLFAILYIAGVNMFVCLFLIGGIGVILFMSVYRMSEKYGQYGLLKKLAKRSIPESIKGKTRTLFLELKKPA
jgi:hypothetical protein